MRSPRAISSMMIALATVVGWLRQSEFKPGAASTRLGERLAPAGWCLTAMLAFLLIPFLARADDFAEALKPLANDSYADTAGVIERLADLADPRAVPLLRAFTDNELFIRKSDKAVILLRSSAMIDAVSGAKVDVPRSELDAVRANNRVRGARPAQPVLARRGGTARRRALRAQDTRGRQRAAARARA